MYSALSIAPVRETARVIEWLCRFFSASFPHHTPIAYASTQEIDIILEIDLSIIDHISPPPQRLPTVPANASLEDVNKYDATAPAEGSCRILFLLTHTVHSSSCCCISSPNQGDVYLRLLLSSQASPFSFLDLALWLIIQFSAFCLIPTLRYWSSVALPP